MPYDTSNPSRPRSIAIIGSGMAGMSAAWLLNQHHAITLFEGDDHIGGHAHTVNTGPNHGDIDVDTGFIVYNERNYPNLVALFAHLGVPTKPSEMSFAASLDNGGFEYSGTGLRGLLGQASNLFNPQFWFMLRDIVRFYKSAPGLTDTAEELDLTLGAFLKSRNYSEAFIRRHILPMGAAIWSTTAADMLDYPLATFVRFFESHGLLQFTRRPQWRTVTGGSAQYVKRLTESFADKIRHEAVSRIERFAGHVELLLEDGERLAFDDVVIATHADDALALLAEPSVDESRLLSAFRYTDNETVLHSDQRLMPKRKRVWSSWNYIDNGQDAGNRKLTVSYWMNSLQGIDPRQPLFVTLNPHVAPDEEKVIRRFAYRHPLFDRRAIAAQQGLWGLQGRQRTWYCGSYFGYGFHEDALQAGLAVAEGLTGVSRPWVHDDHASRIFIDHALPLAAD